MASYKFNPFTKKLDLVGPASGIGGGTAEQYPSSGVVNGTNKNFTFDNTPTFISLEGQALSILNGDYTVVGNIITLINAPTNNPPVNKYLI